MSLFVFCGSVKLPKWYTIGFGPSYLHLINSFAENWRTLNEALIFTTCFSHLACVSYTCAHERNELNFCVVGASALDFLISQHCWVLFWRLLSHKLKGMVYFKPYLHAELPVCTYTGHDAGWLWLISPRRSTDCVHTTCIKMHSFLVVLAQVQFNDLIAHQ